MKRDATYSEIIGPEEFNRINTEEHLYIKSADTIIKKIIAQRVHEADRILEVVELGCGPARLLPRIGEVDRIRLVGVDHDEKFVSYAQDRVRGTSLDVRLDDIISYTHEKPVDIFYSQGVHHHMAKPPTEYLQNVASQLNPGSIFILSDEFLPEYKTEEERRVRATIWYAHIIDHALRYGYSYLAQEEAKTFLDELNTEIDETRVKTPQQIELVLRSVRGIEAAVRKKDVKMAEQFATLFLCNLEKIYSWMQQEDPTINLSRGDYKICDTVFREEVKQAGLRVIMRRTVGPIDSIGAMGIYILEKE